MSLFQGIPLHGEVSRQIIDLYLGRFPTLYFNAFYWRKSIREGMVDNSTQLVIEGFPRSANTFAVLAFEQAQPRKTPVAHHLHVPAQVIEGVKRQLPVLVLIRRPIDAISSLLIREPKLSAILAIKHYVAFYDTVSAFKDSCLLATFEEVTTNYGEVIERLNSKFGTRFSLFEHTETNVRRVYSAIEKRSIKQFGHLYEHKVARPSRQKAMHKKSAMERLNSTKSQALLRKAEALYHELIQARQ